MKIEEYKRATEILNEINNVFGKHFITGAKDRETGEILPDFVYGNDITLFDVLDQERREPDCRHIFRARFYSQDEVLNRYAKEIGEALAEEVKQLYKEFCEL